jgi:hypothetical protein
MAHFLALKREMMVRVSKCKLKSKWCSNELETNQICKTHNGHDLERNDTYILIYFVTNIRDYNKVTKKFKIHGGSPKFF